MAEATITISLLRFIDEVYRAAMTRDERRLRELLQGALAIQLPREVRAEALAIAGASRASFRAPVRLLQLRHRTLQLARTGSQAHDDSQLELELTGARRFGGGDHAAD